MATRVYFSGENTQEGSSGGVKPTASGWQVTSAGFNRGRLPWFSRYAKAFFNKAQSRVYATTESMILMQYVSDPLQAQAIAGTVKGQLRMLESNAAADKLVAIKVWIVSGDGTTARGTLYANQGGVGTTELDAVTLTNRRLFPGGSVALTPVTAQDGDRLVIELGTKMTGVVATYTSTIEIGDADGVADLPEDETTQAQLRPWVEFSQDILFKDQGGLLLRVNYEPTEWPDWPGLYELKTGGLLSDQFARVSTPTPAQGTMCARYTVRPGDVLSGASGERILGRWFESDEEKLDGIGDSWWAWSVQAPAGWQRPSGWSIYHEWHADINFVQAPIKFGTATTSDDWTVAFNSGQETAGPTWEHNATYKLGPMTFDAWTDFIVWVKWASTPTGAMRVWKRTRSGGARRFVLCLDLANIPTLVWKVGPGVGKMYVTRGYYRSAEAFTSVIYDDDVRRGTTLAQVLAGFIPAGQAASMSRGDNTINIGNPGRWYTRNRRELRPSRHR
jgi:hypothetical protein